MLLAGGEKVRTGCLDAGVEGKMILAVLIWKSRWSWWCGSYCDRRAV